MGTGQPEFLSVSRAPLTRAIALVAGAVVLIAVGMVMAGASPWSSASNGVATAAPSAPLTVDLVPGAPHTLAVPEDVRNTLGIRKGTVDRLGIARVPTATVPLVLSGSTALDPTRLVRIRARFAPAEVVEIGQVVDAAASAAAGQTVFRELRSGDQVKKGTLLGVFYSVDVGSKKNDLVDALVQLRLDEEILERFQKTYERGALPEVSLLNAERNAEADRNAVSRALSTLRTWNIPEADIQAVYDEADQISKRHGKRNKDIGKQWARVELSAPANGTIVERNVTLHETVVDNTINLFQIAQVERLLVIANASEELLPTLLKLPTTQRHWTIRTVGTASEGGASGSIDDISYLIDVNQHAAVVKGYIDNPAGQLRAGQYISATIDLPAPENVVEVPVGAIADDGKQCLVFVQTDAARHHYTLRRVQVTHRFDKTVFVRSQLSAAEQALTPADRELGLLPNEPLRAGDRVLAAGVLELKKELEDRESNSAKEPEPKKPE